MINVSNNQEARAAILKSIRDHLSASIPDNKIHDEIRAAGHQLHHRDSVPNQSDNGLGVSLVELFRDRLEAVEGHCILAAGQSEVLQALREILASLRDTPLQPRSIALSDAPVVAYLARQLEGQVEEISITPEPAEMFGYDVGVSTVQAAIAETGTLVLQSDRERHRLISLLPPVHIAIVEADQICETLGEVLNALNRQGVVLSPAITFVTGPSRTADIELTLAIGVHGPQKLYVIVNTGPKLEI